MFTDCISPARRKLAEMGKALDARNDAQIWAALNSDGSAAMRAGSVAEMAERIRLESTPGSWKGGLMTGREEKP